MKILLVSNSQGTPAGLPEDESGSCYTRLVQDALPGFGFACFTFSYLHAGTVDTQFREIVSSNRPDLVVLQLGIIEAALRILPKRVRDFLGAVPGGAFVTKAIHDRQGPWRRFLARRGWRFQDVPCEAFRTHLGNIAARCAAAGIRLAVVRIPPPSLRCERGNFPGNAAEIARYDAAIDEAAASLRFDVVDPFRGNADPTRDSLYLPDSVHFSAAGHRLVARNILEYLAGHDVDGGTAAKGEA